MRKLLNIFTILSMTAMSSTTLVHVKLELKKKQIKTFLWKQNNQRVLKKLKKK